MPKNKDLKNLVRARMTKTGESYSIARMHVVGDAVARPNASAVLSAVEPRNEHQAPIAIYQIKISLAEITPTIWRRVHVVADTRLDDLHMIFQAALGWTNSHLHQFLIDDIRHGVPDLEWEFSGELPEMFDEREVTLRDLIAAKSCTYLYDFGDSWDHAIEIERVDVEPVPGVTYPTCVAGERACPPEDCGGVGGYQNMLQVLADPKDPEHADMKRWAKGMVRMAGGKGPYDAAKFDVETANRAMRRWVRPGKTGRRRGADARA